MARKPLRIQRRRTRGYKLPEGCICVSRPGRFGNPFKLVGDVVYCDASHRRELLTTWVVFRIKCGAYCWYEWSDATTASVVECYRRWALGYFDDDNIVRPCKLTQTDFDELRNRDLACWCKLCDKHKDGKPFDVDCADCAPCHADILGRMANK